jgi:hypothetical protein
MSDRAAWPRYFGGGGRRMTILELPVQPHTALEQYCFPINPDSYFVDIGYDTTSTSFVDLHTCTAEVKVNIAMKQYAWPAIGIFDAMRSTHLLGNYK